jgi:glyoxylase-like metal-dependent hydrolase (beta-lactamase superfamily II)
MQWMQSECTGLAMKCAFCAAAAVLLAANGLQPAHAQSARALISRAIAAEGGIDALRALKALSIRADAMHWEPGESKVAGGEPRFLGNTTLAITWDLANGMARTEWDRDMKYPAVEKLRYTEVTTPSLGFVIDEKATRPVSGVRVAAALRELERASPRLLLKVLEAKNGVRPLANARLGNQQLLAIGFLQGGTDFSILIDPETRLPSAVRTRDDDNIAGDSTYDLVFSDWKAVGDLRIAHTLSCRLNGVEVGKVTYKEVTANPTIAPAVFSASDAIQSAAKGPASTNVPYQWVIRRILLGRFLDSDDIIVPPGGSLKLVELAPNVQHVQGGSANNLIVAMQDHLVVLDAPYGELQSRWVIEAAKTKYPGKPIKYLVLTHHHMDHAGGTRTFIAEGANVIVPVPDKAYFEKAARVPHTIVTDALSKKPRAAGIQEVKDAMSLKDDADEIRLYNIPNPHSDGMILAHAVKSNVVYVTDLLTPRASIERNPGTLAVGVALKQAGITGSIIAGGHGTTVKQADIGAALGTDLSTR